MGWQKLTDSTREDIVGWTTQRRHETNTGVLTKRTPAFDIDIPDQAAADAIEQLVRDRYADCGVLLSRVGKAPKRAIPFRTDTPFKKITAFLVAPGPGGEITVSNFSATASSSSPTESTPTHAGPTPGSVASWAPLDAIACRASTRLRRTSWWTTPSSCWWPSTAIG
jgi:Bifunctional DNA primase/polymerase, N-terminal